MKKILKIIRNGIMVLLAILIISFSTLMIYRQLKVNAIRNGNQITSELGIDEEKIVEIGGIKQYLYIRGENQNNPIILFLHGGPGSPMTPLIYKYQKGLEKNFTVVNWDQRNAGKTYFLNDPNKIYDTLSFDRMVKDVLEVTIYLLDIFDQEKIIILGHSWGSAIGTAFVKTYPEYVSAYIGTGQLINADEGDKLAFETALSKAREITENEDVSIMESLENYSLKDQAFNPKSFQISRKLVNKYLAPNIKDITINDLLLSPYYNLKDVTFYFKDTFEIQKPLMNELANDYDTRNYGTNYDVPVFYILGDSDWVTPTIMAQTFFETIEAPQKELIIIEDAGHMAMINQPEVFSLAVNNVLNSLN